MASTLRFSVEVASDQATNALNVLSTAFDQAGISAKSALLGVGSGSKAVGGFEGKLKSLKSEMAAGDRTINFFARSLNGLLPEASAAGQGIRLLADGLIGGVGLGFALQGVMAVMTLFGERLGEQKAAADKAKASVEKYADAIQKAQIGILSLTSGDAESERKAHVLAVTELRLQRSLAEAHKKKEEVERINNEIALLQQQFDLSQQTSQIQEGRKLEDALFDLRKDTLTEEEALWEDFNRRAAHVALDYSHLTAAQQSDLVEAMTEQTSRKVNEIKWKYEYGYLVEVAAQRKALEDATLKAAEQTAASIKRLRTEGYVFNPLTGQYQEGTKGLYGIKQPGDMGPTDFTPVQFGGTVPTPPLSESERARATADIYGESDDAINKKKEEIKKITIDIASSWIDAMTTMLEETEITVQSMVKLFAQLAGQIMQSAGFALGGPIGALAGALLGKALPSAAGGWGNVPNDTLAQIHKREMVLPPAESDVIRSLARNGGGAAPVNVTINAIDGVSVRDWIVRNGTDFTAGVREVSRQRGGI